MGYFGLVEVLGAIAVLFIGAWYYLGSTYKYWKRLGVPGPQPEFFFGNFKDVVLGKKFVGDHVQNLINQFPGEPLIGIYENRKPRLILKDLDLIKDVLIKDFSCFSERGEEVNENVDPLDSHLVFLDTKRWRYLRSKLSSQFTSGKMKNMFNLIKQCANHFEEYLNVVAAKGDAIECRELSAKYTTDVIASCAFGLDFNTVSDEDSELRKIGKKLFKITPLRKFLMAIRSAAPWLYQLLGKSTTPPEVVEFFMRTVKQMREYRIQTNMKRGDLIDTLNEIKEDQSKTDIELTDSLLTAQAFVFFVGGFETSSTTISNALYELAKRQDVQDKLRQEILDLLCESDGNVTQEGVKAMQYMHMVFQETLRLRPPVPLLARAALKDYTFNGTNTTIRKGQKLFIPVSQIHTDPDIYSDPEVFDPERFTEDNIKVRHPMAWLAFGGGPRNCIGARFAVHQTKLGLMKILSNFKVETCAETQKELINSPNTILMEPIGGIHLKFTKLA